MRILNALRVSIGSPLGLFFATAVAVGWAANTAVGHLDLPDYGTWTGIRPLEKKLRLLRQYAAGGPVDAVLIGSSITDFGVSAKVISSEIERRTGRPFRVFNFSTGAAELITALPLYRLLRTEVRPRYCFIFYVPVRAGRGAKIAPGGPEYILNASPVGRFLWNQRLLQLDAFFWRQPLWERGTALRSLMVHGAFENRVPGHSDVYECNEQGDTLNYSFSFVDQDFEAYAKVQRSDFLNHVKPIEDSEAFLREVLDDNQIGRTKEFSQALQDDECSACVISISPSSLFLRDPGPEYWGLADRAARVVTEQIRGRMLERPRLALLPYEVMDTVHFNTFAAERISEQVAAAFSGSPAEPFPTFRCPQTNSVFSNDPTYSSWSIGIARSARDVGRRLEVRVVNSWQVPALPQGPLYAKFIRVDNSIEFVPAQLVEQTSSEYRLHIDTSPLHWEAGDLYLFTLCAEAGGRRVALPAPVAGFRWMP